MNNTRTSNSQFLSNRNLGPNGEYAQDYNMGNNSTGYTPAESRKTARFNSGLNTDYSEPPTDPRESNENKARVRPHLNITSMDQVEEINRLLNRESLSNRNQYVYGDMASRIPTYKKEKRYTNGAVSTDVTKIGSMNYNAPQAYTDATGVDLRVIKTDRVRRDFGDSSNISLGFGTDFSTARAGDGATENMGKTFY